MIKTAELLLDSAYVVPPGIVTVASVGTTVALEPVVVDEGIDFFGNKE
jgi:hypothetical protein